MFQDVKEFMLNLTTPENTAIVIDTCILLHHLGVEQHTDKLAYIIDTQNQFLKENNLDDIYSLLENYTHQVLLEFGIIIEEHTPLEISNRFLKTVTYILHYGDPHSIALILNSDESLEDQFNSCCELITSAEWSEHAPYLRKVQESFMEKTKHSIEEILEKEVDEYTDTERDEVLRLQLKKYLKKYPNILVHTALLNGLRYHQDVSEAIKPFHEALLNLNKNPRQLAIELIGFSLIKYVSSNEVITFLSTITEDYITDVNTLSQVQHEIIKQLGEL